MALLLTDLPGIVDRVRTKRILANQNVNIQAEIERNQSILESNESKIRDIETTPEEEKVYDDLMTLIQNNNV